MKSGSHSNGNHVEWKIKSKRRTEGKVEQEMESEVKLHVNFGNKKQTRTESVYVSSRGHWGTQDCRVAGQAKNACPWCRKEQYRY